MKEVRPSNKIKGLIGLILLSIFWTTYQSLEVPHREPSSLRGGCASLSDFFVMDRGRHFHEIIRQLVNLKPELSSKLNKAAWLLDEVNLELINPNPTYSLFKAQKWLEAYEALFPHQRPPELFQIQQDPQSFFAKINSESQELLLNELSSVLLEENLWSVRNSRGQLTSFGVRLSEDTWGRVALFPKSWKLTIYKSKAQKSLLLPELELPVQMNSLILSATGQVGLVFSNGQTWKNKQTMDSLTVTTLCEMQQAENATSQSLPHAQLTELPR